MLWKNLVAVAAFLVPSTAASPHRSERQDACAKAVSSGPESACSSFLRKTVTPCPVTLTTSRTVTDKGEPVTVTRTRSLTPGNTATFTYSNNITETRFWTLRETTSSTSIVSATTTSVATIRTTTPMTRDTIYVDVETTRFLTVTSTAVVTSTAAAQPQKRSLGSFEDTNHEPAPSNGTLSGRHWVEDRAQCPSTSSPHKVPKYASTCPDVQAYSDACQQLGVWPDTTLLDPSTTWATETSTSYWHFTSALMKTTMLDPTSTVTTTKPVTHGFVSYDTDTRVITIPVTATRTVESTESLTYIKKTTVISTSFVEVVATTTAVVTSTKWVAPRG